MYWPHSVDGKYFVKMGYKKIRKSEAFPALGPSSSGQLGPSLWSEIWNAKVSQKVELFVWKVCQNALPILANMAQK